MLKNIMEGPSLFTESVKHLMTSFRKQEISLIDEKTILNNLKKEKKIFSFLKNVGGLCHKREIKNFYYIS